MWTPGDFRNPSSECHVFEFVPPEISVSVVALLALLPLSSLDNAGVHPWVLLLPRGDALVGVTNDRAAGRLQALQVHAVKVKMNKTATGRR